LASNVVGQVDSKTLAVRELNPGNAGYRVPDPACARRKAESGIAESGERKAGSRRSPERCLV